MCLNPKPLTLNPKQVNVPGEYVLVFTVANTVDLSIVNRSPSPLPLFPDFRLLQVGGGVDEHAAVPQSQCPSSKLNKLTRGRTATFGHLTCQLLGRSVAVSTSMRLSVRTGARTTLDIVSQPGRVNQVIHASSELRILLGGSWVIEKGTVGWSN